jgi:hypothetical protein
MKWLILCFFKLVFLQMQGLSTNKYIVPATAVDSTAPKKTLVDKIEDAGLPTEHEGWDIFSLASLGMMLLMVPYTAVSSSIAINARNASELAPVSIFGFFAMLVTQAISFFASTINFKRKKSLKGRGVLYAHLLFVVAYFIGIVAFAVSLL